MHNYKQTALLFALCTYLCADFCRKIIHILCMMATTLDQSCFTRQKQQQIPNTAAPMIFFNLHFRETKCQKICLHHLPFALYGNFLRLGPTPGNNKQGTVWYTYQSQALQSMLWMQRSCVIEIFSIILYNSFLYVGFMWPITLHYCCILVEQDLVGRRPIDAHLFKQQHTKCNHDQPQLQV